MIQFSFNSRETYLQFRKEWKAEYEANIQKSRELKHAHKGALRELSKHELTMERDKWGGLKYTPEWWKLVASANRLLSQRDDLRMQAKILLSTLQGAKEEAQEQWLAARAG